ncbi:phosphatase [Saccharothrix coeruleofusca]|uniref:Phosphatase n=2 Tax=Saccharothrix coeruleofusca TaxID=33919 RepID=A0A918EBX6_9PSEU|nr:PhoX family phosphatase [Saccharothrix coeruleofusca]GGP38901.1 phosphatase [Saccharothrix coeruleofusca]
MSSSTERGRRLLPLLPNHPLGRSAMTCKYRCGDACAHEAPNTSANPYFGDVVSEVVRRRGLLKAGAVLAVAGAGASLGAGAAVAKPGGRPEVDADADLGGGRRRDGLNFTAVAPNQLDEVVVPEGYQQAVVMRWGDPVLPGAPAFDFDRQTAAAQAKQFGYNNDFCGLVPLPGWNRWLMVSNHEYTTEDAQFLGWDENNPTREQVEIGWAAHGMSVVLVERDHRSGKLEAKVDRRYNRRITATTPFKITGPAAGSKYLKTSADPTGTTVLGTLNNCAGGVTPWGTVLSGEENYNQYFANGASVTDKVTKDRLARYGMASGTTTTRKWERFDKRFDLAQEPNEANRFGWVVEVDPLDPTSTPVKHTALGRFKHEGANVIIARDGRVVAYMGDDERFDYMYKFVSDEKYKPGNSKHAREHNKKLLDKGTLYVAQFTGDTPAAEVDGTGKLPADGEFDGTGKWIPLASGTRSFVPGFTAEEVYVFTRLAADAVGATKMDRPEDVEPNPRNRRVYAALTNNTDRGKADKEGATEPNPRVRNKHGHVLELEERRGDNTALEFSWKLLLVCGDPAAPDTYFGGYDKSQVSPISCPDNLAFDSQGNLWISTDGNALGSNDGLFAVPVEGRYRGRVKQFLTVPRGAETCGPWIEDDFVLVSVQHPGEIDGASAANPLSHWPDGGASQPRPSVVMSWKKDKGRICG